MLSWGRTSEESLNWLEPIQYDATLFMPAVPASSLQLHTPSTHVSWTRRDRVKRTCCQYGRASHTGNAIRATYSSVSVGVVHVLCACAQVQSTVWCSCLITQFSPCCKMYFYIRKGQKHCILRCFCFPSAAKKSGKNAQKGSKIDFQKHLTV